MDPFQEAQKVTSQMPTVDQNVQQPLGSVAPGGKEAGPVVPRVEAKQSDVREFVAPSPELQRPEIPQAVADAGVSQGQDAIKLDSQAIHVGVVSHNPTPAGGIVITFPKPIEELRSDAKGDPKESKAWIGTIGVFEEGKREERLDGLPKAA